MAVPLYLLRRQGVRVDAAVLAAPAEQADVVAWYRRMAPGLGWTLVGDTGDAATPRLVFLRGSEGLQLTIGGTVGHLVTPVQYVFLTGLPTTAIPDVLAAAPMVPGVDIARLTRPQPTPAPVPDVAPPSAPTPTPVVTPDPAPQPIASAEPERRTRVIIRRRPREAPPQPESTPRPESRPIARPRPETKREHDPPTPAAPEIHKPVVERPKTAERPDKPIVPPAPDGGGDAGTDGE
jgi:hypothetical protein